jgi:hypothetical protein
VESVVTSLFQILSNHICPGILPSDAVNYEIINDKQFNLEVLYDGRPITGSSATCTSVYLCKIKTTEQWQVILWTGNEN